MRGSEREAVTRRAAARTERPPAERGVGDAGSMQAVAAAVGNQAFAAAARSGRLARAAVGRQGHDDAPGPPEMPEPVPPKLKALADGQIVPALREVSEALRGDPPTPETLRTLREKVARTRALFDTVAAPSGLVGDNWFGALGETAIARTMLDDMIKPGSEFDLRMSWGKAFGTARQLAGILQQGDAAAPTDGTPAPTSPGPRIEFEVCPRIEGAIREIPTLTTAESIEPLQATLETTRDIAQQLVDLAQGNPLGRTAAVEFEKGWELVEQWTLPESEHAGHVADRLDGAADTASDLAGEHGWSATPLPAPTPTFEPAPSPNPLPPPPPPPL